MSKQKLFLKKAGAALFLLLLILSPFMILPARAHSLLCLSIFYLILLVAHTKITKKESKNFVYMSSLYQVTAKLFLSVYWLSQAMSKQKQTLGKAVSILLAALFLLQTFIVIPLRAEQLELFPILPEGLYYKIYNAVYWDYNKKTSIYAFKLTYPEHPNKPFIVVNITTILDTPDESLLTVNITSPQQLATYQSYIDKVKKAFESKDSKWFFDRLLDFLGKNKKDAKKAWDQIIQDAKKNPARTYDAIVYYRYSDRPDVGETPKLYVQALNHYDGIQNFENYLANMIRDYALGKTLGINILWFL